MHRVVIDILMLSVEAVDDGLVVVPEDADLIGSDAQDSRLGLVTSEVLGQVCLLFDD